jgi:hypothetical protein
MVERRLTRSALALCCLLGCSSDATPEQAPESPDSASELDDDGDVDAGSARDASADASPAARDARVGTSADAGKASDPGTAPDAAASNDAGHADAAQLAPDAGALARFSFFVTSFKAMKQLSGSASGFGGDLRHGETGTGAGLKGADKLCSEIAEQSMAGSRAKQWRAFLSATAGEASGGAVHAIERIGAGPWYDRQGRLVANSKTDLLQTRPNADAVIKNDLPNEDGVPNHNPDGSGNVDNHHVLTGSGPDGRLYASDVKATCNDWTKSEVSQTDAPRVGLSWPRGGGGGTSASHWISAMDESGCGAGASLDEMGGPNNSNPTVGSGGGYGAIYCFALTP